MKHFILFVLISFCPAVAFCQQYVNPDTIYQSGDIILKNTDVYYKPFAPPGPHDTRANLCNESDLLRDPNGVGSQWRDYLPMVYDSALGLVALRYWSPPCDSGNVLGPNVVWQRLFTAKRKADGTPSDIIAGGIDTVRDTIIFPRFLLPPDTVINTHLVRHQVTVSKNEDVDFRASGRIKLKSGFHVKPGAFFHAYTEPKWDTTVFSDEFDSAAKFHNQWYVANGHAGGTDGGLPEVGEDSNVYLDTDYQAHDGHALDLVLREANSVSDTARDTVSSTVMLYSDTSNCQNIPDPLFIDSLPYKSFFSSAFIRSCPFPYASTGYPLGGSAYAHAQYGKYEFRDKIPHTLHHTNNWGSSGDNEYDLNETTNVTMGLVHPNWGHAFRYGPFNGIFKKRAHDTLFLSPGAGWCAQNKPLRLIINNFLYIVDFDGYSKDTVVARPGTIPALQGGFPASLVNDTTDSVSFYYEKYDHNDADSVTWTVSGKIFSAPYHVVGGSKYFSKDYQPTQLILTTGFRVQKTFNCRWDSALNSVLLVNPDGSPDTLLSTDLHTNTERYQYIVSEGYGYPVPTVEIDRDTDWSDTAAYATTPYRYHTFTMEWLPHEVRFLIDSNVVRRFPDRLIPKSSKYYDWASTEPRSPASIFPAEIDLDFNGSDVFGVDDSVDGSGNYKSSTYQERNYFDTHTGSPGFWDVEIPPGSGHWYHAAHHLLDYVKVWDVPKNVTIPGYPN